MDTCLRRGRTNRVFLPSGFAKIFGDDAGVPSRHWLIFGDRLYQRAIRSEEFVPIVALWRERAIGTATGGRDHRL
jgi:hypothetical protein